jgi:hypothetical protein
MYQLLMGQDAQGNAWPYDRWGDIWSGHLAKKYVEDVLGGCVAINYAAHIKHERASNVYANIQKELSGYKINETIWEKLSKYFTPSYEYISYIVEDNDVMLFGEESKKYAEAMRVWSRLTQ